jgi:hypothetical protein
MKNTIVIFLIAILADVLGCRAQKSVDATCSQKPEIQYDRVSRADRKAGLVERSEGAFIVRFMNDFKDSIRVYVNDSLRFDDYVLTDQMTSQTDKVFGYRYPKHGAKKAILKIGSQTQDSCCIVEVKEGYKFVYVFMTEPNHWIVRFSNVNYIH